MERQRWDDSWKIVDGYGLEEFNCFCMETWFHLVLVTVSNWRRHCCTSGSVLFTWLILLERTLSWTHWYSVHQDTYRTFLLSLSLCLDPSRLQHMQHLWPAQGARVVQGHTTHTHISILYDTHIYSCKCIYTQSLCLNTAKYLKPCHFVHYQMHAHIHTSNYLGHDFVLMWLSISAGQTWLSHTCPLPGMCHVTKRMRRWGSLLYDFYHLINITAMCVCVFVHATISECMSVF